MRKNFVAPVRWPQLLQTDTALQSGVFIYVNLIAEMFLRQFPVELNPNSFFHEQLWLRAKNWSLPINNIFYFLFNRGNTVRKWWDS